MPSLFAGTLFLSATLLFLLQPLVGKMLLPYFGGSSAVWNTCMVFFQALLLAGYSYAHAAPAWLGTRRHVVFHLLLLAGAAAVLPIAIPAEAAPPPGIDPTLRLLVVLFLAVGLPFFVVSTTAPLVQHWFAATGHPGGRDPYFLYAASNAGSMLALLAYPFVVEPLLPLRQQTIGWVAGYGLLVLMLTACGLVVWRTRRATPTDTPHAPATVQDAAPPSRATRLRWIALAFVPSSLLLGVTTYLSIDVAPMPLVWVLPLAVYLLSFILVFGPMLARGLHLFGWILPLVVLAQAFFLVARLPLPLEQQIAANLLALFVAAMVCHGELARTRPAARHLTEFYLWMSLGGVLGGAFNALAAPLLFPGTYEYPLVLVLLCLLAPQPGAASGSEQSPDSFQPTVTAAEKRGRRARLARIPRPRNGANLPPSVTTSALLGPSVAAAVEGLAALLLAMTVPGSLGLSVGLLVLLGLSLYAKAVRLGVIGTSESRQRLNLLLDLAIPAVLALVAFVALGSGPLGVSFGLLTLLGLSLYGRPLRLGLGIAVLLGVGLWARESGEGVIYRHRNFYGTLRIVDDATPRQRNFSGSPDVIPRWTLYHGQTLHGSQARTGKPEDSKVPRFYYYPTGPAGDVFKTFVQGHAGCRVGVIGLGTGSLAAYGEKGQHFTFFEIDPTVIELANHDSPYFTYLHDSPAKCEVVAGDARLMLREVRTAQQALEAANAWSYAAQCGQSLAAGPAAALVGMATLATTSLRGTFDVLVIDAFSGDAIPTHLVTREALQMYRELLPPQGLLLFHISNQYFDLEPVLASLAAAEGMAGLGRSDRATEAEEKQAKSDSHWVLLARHAPDIAPVATKVHPWHGLRKRPDLPPWTDDYSSLLRVLGFSKEAATADP